MHVLMTLGVPCSYLLGGMSSACSYDLGGPMFIFAMGVCLVHVSYDLGSPIRMFAVRVCQCYAYDLGFPCLLWGYTFGVPFFFFAMGVHQYMF